MSVVEITNRETKERDETTPPMLHIQYRSTTKALCGIDYKSSGLDYRDGECVVCRDLVAQMGWRI